MPYGAAQIVFPLQVAWSVFWRLSKTHLHGSPTASCAGPAAMMEYIRSRAEHFMSALKPVELKEPGLIFLAERLRGGLMRPVGTYADADNLTTNIALHKLAISVHQDAGEDP